MGLYARYVLPRLIHFACGLEPNRRQREKVVPRAHGRVLEIGAGSGHNLSYYDPSRVDRLYALEPSPEMWALAQPRAGEVPFPVEFLQAPAEEIPLPEASVDSVLTTYTLCTVAQPEAALSEIRRVLRRDGELIFCEHGAADEPRIRRWQDRLDPVWTRLAGGCHMNREILALLERAGFAISDWQAMYLPGPRVLTFNVWGAAAPG